MYLQTRTTQEDLHKQYEGSWFHVFEDQPCYRSGQSLLIWCFEEEIQKEIEHWCWYSIWSGSSTKLFSADMLFHDITIKKLLLELIEAP